MSEGITALMKENAALVTKNLRYFFRILVSPVEFISSIKHSSSEQLVSATFFAALMSILNLVIALPLFRLLGMNVETTSYFVVDTILTYGFFFIYGSAFHLSAKIFRGKGNYTSSLVSFLYLKAFSPIGMIVGIPLELIFIGGIVNGTDIISIMSSPLSFVELISLFSLLLVLSWYLISMVKVFCIVHKLGKTRGSCVVLVGFSLWCLISVLYEFPILQLFYKAYRTSGA